MDRRSLLSSAVLGSAGVVGATAFGSVGPEAAYAAESVDLAAELDAAGLHDPNFVDGRVTSINGSQLLVEAYDVGVIERVYVAGGTSIWKLRPAGFDKIEVGDRVSARGVRMPDGALAADAVWMNIVSFTAHVTSIGRNVINLDHAGSNIVGRVVPGTSVASYNNTPAVSDMSMIQVGQHVQVLGAQRPDSDEVEIATLYAHVH
ncbi:MAG: DUF5666 domain-containing protein [Micromonosporaceae bacterium]